MSEKQALRRELKDRRAAHFAAIPAMQRGLLFRRPPGALVDLVPAGAVISVYHEMAAEAPAGHYARWFFEQGHRIALPWFASRSAPMAEPKVVFVPLLGFTGRGERIGYGGGHYDRWLAAHPNALPIGLAWDCQLAESLPTEPHDIRLAAVVTPTALYGPF